MGSNSASPIIPAVFSGFFKKGIDLDMVSPPTVDITAEEEVLLPTGAKALAETAASKATRARIMISRNVLLWANPW